MFKLFIVFGLFLSPVLHATTPSEFYGQSMQEAQEWTEKMWPTNTEKEYVYTLEDFYMAYSYGSADEMAEEFAEQLCQGKFMYYAEVVVHDYLVDEIDRVFKRNTLLEALFNNQVFVNKLNTCLEAHDKNIETVVALTIAATTLNKFIVAASLGSGLSLSIRKGLQKLFSKKAAIIEKKTAKFSNRWKQKFKPSNLKNLTFKGFLNKIKTTAIVIAPTASGAVVSGALDSLLKDNGYRRTYNEPFPHPDSERAKCEQIKAKEKDYKRIYAQKLKDAEQVYLTNKEKLKDTDKLNLLEEEYQYVKDVLDEEYELMQAFLLEEQLRTGNYFSSCSTLSPFPH